MLLNFLIPPWGLGGQEGGSCMGTNLCHLILLKSQRGPVLKAALHSLHISGSALQKGYRILFNLLPGTSYIMPVGVDSVQHTHRHTRQLCRLTNSKASLAQFNQHTLTSGHMSVYEVSPCFSQFCLMVHMYPAMYACLPLKLCIHEKWSACLETTQ